MPTRHQIQGFSLIELMITLVVFGILTMAAIPSISDWLRNTRLRGEAESVLSGLQTARNEAVRRNRPVSFWLVSSPQAGALGNDCALASNADGWVVSVNDPDGACAEAPSTSVAPMIVRAQAVTSPDLRVAGSRLKADGSNALASSITFDGLGRVVSTFVNDAQMLNRISVAYGNALGSDRPLQIDIDASGGARLCDTTVDESTDPRACPTDPEAPGAPPNEE